MTAAFYVGDAIEVMAKLPEKSVDLILTSPPFLALRSYLPADHPDKALEGGSQSTPGEFIDWLLDVAEACDRVLAPHGSLCIELGDTYSGGAVGWTEEDRNPGFGRSMEMQQGGAVKTGSAWPLPKSLSLIPESFRFAMVYGRNPHTGRTTEPWRLRNVIRWVRPNPPVGALGDKFRPATSELMVFCKSAKRYFDLDAVRSTEEVVGRPAIRPANPNPKHQAMRDEGIVTHGVSISLADATYNKAGGAPPLDWWNIPLLEGEEETRYGPKPINGPTRIVSAKKSKGVRQARTWREQGDVETNNPLGTPPLDWWNIPPGGYEGAHYAVFPAELCVKPVKAMCPEKVCRVCGEPSRRITEKTEDYAEFRLAAKTMRKDPGMEGAGKGTGGLAGSGYNRDPNGVALGSPTAIHRSGEKYRTVDWTDCGHDDWRPGVVLDPFAGSGTTLAVATGHGRDAIGIDLDERNYDLALERVGPFILERAL